MNRKKKSAPRKYKWPENYNILRESHPTTLPLEISTQLHQWRHQYFPGLNTFQNESIFNAEDAINFYQSPPAVISKPIPCLSTVYTPMAETPCLPDKTLKLVRDKLSWKKNTSFQRNLARKALKDYGILDRTKKNLKENKPIATLPFVIARLAHLRGNNPDEYFDGLYNWYYGNSLATANIGGQNCLLFAGGENLNEFWFSFYNRSSSSETIPEICPQLKIPLEDNAPIYDIVPAKDHTSVGVRQRDKCYFFIYGDDIADITLEKCLKVEKKVYPFISMDSSEYEFCTVDAGRNVKFWMPRDSEYCYRATTLPTPDYVLDDMFAQVKYSAGKNPQEFMVIDRKKLYHYDKRVNVESPIKTINPLISLEVCDQLSLLIPSLIEGYWYIASNHSCLLYDVRGGFVQKWTHMVSQPPAIGTTVQINKEKSRLEECILLAGQSTNDVVALYNKWNGEESTPNVLPVGVPDRISTLHEAHSKGLLTDPSFTKRFTRCLIGMAPYKRKKRIGAFTLYSTGDVFHQCIHRRKKSSRWNPDEDTRLQKRELDHLKRWQTDYLYQLTTTPSDLRITRLIDFEYLSQHVNCENPAIPSHPPPNLRGKALWKKSKRTLESYCDFLAPHILHDFGADEESEWYSDEESESEPCADEESECGIGEENRTPDPIANIEEEENKVVGWLNRTATSNADGVVNIDELFMDEPDDDAKIAVDAGDLIIPFSDDDSND